MSALSSGLPFVFLGSAPYALPSLRRLVEGGCPPAAVITRPDRPAGRGRKITATAVKEEAKRQNLPICQPENKQQLQELLSKLKPQLLLNVAYGMILPKDVLTLPPRGCLNLHPSLLPRYRGAAPIQRALLAGERTTGATVLYMSPRLDAGDIVLQEQTPIGPEENFGELHDRLADLGAALLYRAVTSLVRGGLTRTPQDDRAATFAPPLTREEEAITWSDPAEKIFNQVRALAPLPGAYTYFRGMRLKIWKAGLARPAAKSSEQAPDLPPGHICHGGPDSLAVQCGAGVLPLLEVQPASKRRMEIRSFVQGYQPLVGEQFA